MGEKVVLSKGLLLSLSQNPRGQCFGPPGFQPPSTHLCTLGALTKQARMSAEMSM